MHFFYNFFYNLFFYILTYRLVEANVLTRALRNIPGVVNLAFYPPINQFNPRPSSNFRSYQPYSYNQPAYPPKPKYNPPAPYYDDFKPAAPRFKSNSFRPNDELFGPCGYIPTKISNYVANGDNTDNKLWPWYVQLVIAGNNKSESETLCGGTIIHKKYVLTAAHCFDDLPQTKHSRNTVVLARGLESTGRLKNGKKENTIRLKAKDVFIHPDYIPTMTESEAIKRGVNPGPLNDVALIELRHDNAEVYGKLMPACLPSGGYQLKKNTECKIMGHGFMSASDEDDFVMPNVLQMADVRLSDNQECKDGVKMETIRSKINENTICIRGPVHPCVGDSGGPLICAGESSGDIQGSDSQDDYENELNADQWAEKTQMVLVWCD